jgi:two-component system LytT family sensor kinase
LIYIQLLERMALIALAAYVYNQSHIFKNLIKDELKLSDKIGMVLFFSAISIIGTYTGVNLDPYALANTRPIGAIMAGFVGGPVIGIIVGLIAGTHRFFLGGFTALACAIATVAEGLVGAMARKYSKDGSFSVKNGFIGAVVAEILQMFIILTFSRPLEDSVNLVRTIALPMIIINSLGVVVFINIIKNSREEYHRVGAIQSQKVLSIAKRTLNHVRKGLNKNTAKNIAEIIYEIGNLEGVLIADSNKLLSYCGRGIDEAALDHNLEEYYKEPYYRKISFASNGKQVFFYFAPIYGMENTFEGLMGLQAKSEKDLDYYFEKFARELSDLLSNQMEIYKLNKLAHEASVAEYKALRAQIEPHFLFNALNTIASFCRTNPLKARELILALSNYFRQTLKRQEDFVKLYEEIDFIQSYLSIEKSRFGERLEIKIEIPEELLNIKMPVFILQPIIENSIKHGILPKEIGGLVRVKAEAKGENVEFTIEDSGVGMSEERLKEVVSKWPGIGLKNVNDRLKLLYGKDHGLRMSISADSGTSVNFHIQKEVM